MKILITFKDPDGVSNAILEKRAEDSSLDAEYISNKLSEWIKWDEYITVEFDTEANTATVIPNH